MFNSKLKNEVETLTRECDRRDRIIFLLLKEFEFEKLIPSGSIHYCGGCDDCVLISLKSKERNRRIEKKSKELTDEAALRHLSKKDA